MDTRLEIVGLSAPAGAGKSFVAERVLRPMGYALWALADAFKIAAVGRGQLTYDEVFHTKPPHVRAILQRTGTEEGRLVFGEDVWCETALAWMQHLSNTMGLRRWVLTDCRFPNEIAFVQRHGGRVFRIQAPNRVAANGMAPEARQHISETALNDFQGFDGFIENDIGQEQGLGERVRVALAAVPNLRAA